MKHLRASKISKAFTTAAKGKLYLNRHQSVDERVPVNKKQAQVEADVRASDKADFTQTMKEVPL